MKDSFRRGLWVVYETRGSFQMTEMYNQLMTLCFFFIISMKIVSEYIDNVSLMGFPER